MRQMLEVQLSSLAWNDLERRQPLRARILREMTRIGIESDVARSLVDELPEQINAEQARYLPLGPGAVFSFGVAGGRAAGQKFVESVELCSHLANIGDVRTLVIHPGSTTHQQLSDDQLVAAGVTPDLVRISVGIEDVDDILWDLDQALEQAVKQA